MGYRGFVIGKLCRLLSLLLFLALLFSLSAHGIMTLNDFKAIEGDKIGYSILPVQLGPKLAALIACIVMLIPQLIVIAYLLGLGVSVYAYVMIFLLIGQLLLMAYFYQKPIERALFYSGFGVPIFVSGMMVAAFGIRQFGVGI
jgi:chlorophyll synthase